MIVERVLITDFAKVLLDRQQDDSERHYSDAYLNALYECWERYIKFIEKKLSKLKRPEKLEVWGTELTKAKKQSRQLFFIVFLF